MTSRDITQGRDESAVSSSANESRDGVEQCVTHATRQSEGEKSVKRYMLMTLGHSCSGKEEEKVNLTTTEQSPSREVPPTTVTSPSSLASFSPSTVVKSQVNVSTSPSTTTTTTTSAPLFSSPTAHCGEQFVNVQISAVKCVINSEHVNSDTQYTASSTNNTLPCVTVTNSSPVTQLRSSQSDTLTSPHFTAHQLSSLCTSSPDLFISKVSCVKCLKNVTPEIESIELVTGVCPCVRATHSTTSLNKTYSSKLTWTPKCVTTSIAKRNKRHSLDHQHPVNCASVNQRSKSISHHTADCLNTHRVNCSGDTIVSCKCLKVDAHSCKMSRKSTDDANEKSRNEMTIDATHNRSDDDEQCNKRQKDTHKSSSVLEFNHETPVLHESIVLIERETWDKKTEFLLAVIGFAVDLGNVGAFLIPWIVMLIFGGLPLFYLELALGQYYRNGCLTLWKRICPIMKGIGYAICLTDLYMAMYYNTVIAWALYYLMASFTTELPWTHCNNAWNTDSCMLLHERSGNVSNATSPAEEFFERQVLQIHEAGGFDDIGPIKWSLAFCLAFVFILVYFSLWKGVKSSGKAVWVTAIMPYFVLFALLIRGITLEGSYEGIMYYLSPQWNKLYEINVWIDAATQIFFSLGPGFGTLLALSSYNKFHNNCYRDAIFTSTINCLTSFLAGFVIFSVLGYMAFVLKKDVSNVAADGPGLVFVVYPEAIANMPGSVVWSILFFIMLITLGLDSTFGGLEAVITGLCDEYPHVLRVNREYFVALLLLFIWICALPTTTYGGQYVIQFLDSYGTSTSLLFIVFIEAVAVCWFYGSNKISKQIKQMLGFTPGIFWRICWQYITPIFLFALLTASIYNYDDLEFKSYQYPRWSIPAGWLLTMSSVSCIPIYACYMLLTQTTGSLRNRFISSLKPLVIVDVCSCDHHCGGKKSADVEGNAGVVIVTAAINDQCNCNLDNDMCTNIYSSHSENVHQNNSPEEKVSQKL